MNRGYVISYNVDGRIMHNVYGQVMNEEEFQAWTAKQLSTDAALGVHDHGTHTHSLYVGDETVPAYEEFGVYKSRRDAAQEIRLGACEQMRQVLNNADYIPGSVYTTGARLEIQSIIDSLDYVNFCWKLADAMEGKLPSGYEIRWLDTTDEAGELQSIVAVENSEIHRRIFDKMMRCWSAYVIPLLPEGEDNDGDYRGESPVMLLHEEWAVIDG